MQASEPVPVLACSNPPGSVQQNLSLCVFLPSANLADSVRQFLGKSNYAVSFCKNDRDFLQAVESGNPQFDCLIFERTPDVCDITGRLCDRAILLPAIFLVCALPDPPLETAAPTLYHSAEVLLASDRIDLLASSIQTAIARFLNLSPDDSHHLAATSTDPETERGAERSIVRQQHRLADKLRERLGYLGVYYKRNPNNFFRNLTPDRKQAFLKELRSGYREIVLLYFRQESMLNQKIDDFVNMSFFADISVTQLVEIHMELMDEFSKQLKLEGRSEEMLLDYRLTLIDIIAHLCEMYRRSIPRES